MHTRNEKQNLEKEKYDILIGFLLLSTLFAGALLITTSSYLVIGGFKFMLAMVGNI